MYNYTEFDKAFLAERKTRHCCSVIPVSANISRIGAMTPSRARISAMGKERDVVGNLLVI